MSTILYLITKTGSQEFSGIMLMMMMLERCPTKIMVAIFILFDYTWNTASTNLPRTNRRNQIKP